MKFTLSWLKTHLDTDADAMVLAGKLTAIGLEVESVTDPGKALAPFVVAEIISAEQHPNADRLRVCMVNIGADAPVQVVCGAPNARAGLRTVFGAPGTFVPGSGITLKISSIRGVESRGMLCSAKELTLSEESDGIIELQANAIAGQPFAALVGLNDPVFEIKLTPNRPDCTGVRGIARDLAAAGIGTLKPQSVQRIAGSFKSPIGVALKLQPHEKACPYFIGRYFKGVKNGPSPTWLQERLTAIGLRPISALVDITNFMTFDQARPLHVFDADKIKGDIHVRMAAMGETLNALNGKAYTLDDGMAVIADDQGAQSIAGIMGGAETGCTESTSNVFLECAYFDPSATTLTGRKLNILSDARYRFERGVDPQFMRDGAEMASQLILECCGGQASELVIAGAPPAAKPPVLLRSNRCKNLGGHDVPPEQQEKILRAIGCTNSQKPEGFEITFPSWRPDMVGEADCVEEILRLIGFDAIAPTSLPREHALTQSAYSPIQKRASTVRRTMAARGFLETVTFSFMGGRLAERFAAIPPEARIMNPISADLDVMRPSILPNLLHAAQKNAARGFADVALFEVGPIYKGSKEQDSGIKQEMVAAGLRAGTVVPRHWAAEARKADVFDAKADALAALEAAKAPMGNLQVSAEGAGPAYHPGRSGVLRLGASILAQFGELHPALLQQVDYAESVAGFEVFLDQVPLAKETGATKKLVDMPDLQPVTRDFAFVLPREVQAAALVRAVQGADKTLITGVAVFDLYQGKGVADGHKSIALAVTLQPRERSLTEADLEALAAKITAAATKATGAVLRG